MAAAAQPKLRTTVLELSSLGVDKLALVFDIGAAYTKAGFAGESIPRCIVPSVVEVQGRKVRVFDPEDRRSASELREILIYFFHDLLYKVSPEGRREEARIQVGWGPLRTSRFMESSRCSTCSSRPLTAASSSARASSVRPDFAVPLPKSYSGSTQFVLKMNSCRVCLHPRCSVCSCLGTGRSPRSSSRQPNFFPCSHWPWIPHSSLMLATRKPPSWPCTAAPPSSRPSLPSPLRLRLSIRSFSL